MARLGQVILVPASFAGARGPTCIASVALLKVQPYHPHEFEVCVLSHQKALHHEFHSLRVSRESKTPNPKSQVFTTLNPQP